MRQYWEVGFWTRWGYCVQCCRSKNQVID